MAQKYQQNNMNDPVVDLKVDVEVLKTQVSNITHLCEKMDTIIEKLVDNHDRMVNQIYDDMNKRKDDTIQDIKELHSRITTVDRNMTDKLELTERRIMDEIKSLRSTIDEHNKKEDEDLKKIFQWKWMVAGGVIVLAWIISNIKIEALLALFA
jgi:predicted  nucleic acid-binding Zn-ribbon protein